MNIENSNAQEIDRIFELYEVATAYMKSKNVVVWPFFERELVEREIREKRQWKIVIDGEIACVWATTESDPEIWQDRNADPSIYIHRIATNPKFRGRGLVSKIAKWSIKYGASKHKQYVRMDTVGENKGLIRHYGKYGFEFLGLSKLTDTDSLPAHYQDATVSLFQIQIQGESVEE